MKCRAAIVLAGNLFFVFSVPWLRRISSAANDGGGTMKWFNSAADSKCGMTWWSSAALLKYRTAPLNVFLFFFLIHGPAGRRKEGPPLIRSGRGVFQSHSAAPVQSSSQHSHQPSKTRRFPFKWDYHCFRQGQQEQQQSAAPIVIASAVSSLPRLPIHFRIPQINFPFSSYCAIVFPYF